MASARVEQIILKIEVAKADIANAKKALEEAGQPLDSLIKKEEALTKLNEKLIAQMQGEAAAAAKFKQETLTAAQALEKFNAEKAKIGRQGELKKIAADVAALPKSLRESQEAATKLAASLERIGATEDEIRGVAREVAKLDDAKAKADARPLPADVPAAGAGGGGNRRSNRVTRLGTDIRALPAIPIPNSSLSTDVFGKAIAIFGALNPVMLGAIAGVAGLVVGLQNLTAEATRTTTALIAGQKEVITAVKQSTSEQIRESVKAKQAQLEVIRAQIDENKRALDGLTEQAGPVGRAIADALDLGGAQALRVATQDLEAQERAAALASDRLTQALSSQEVAQNDLIALYEQKLARRDADNEARILAEINAKNLNSESVRKQIMALQEEIALRQKYIDAGKLSAKAAADYQQQIDKLNATLGALQGLTPEIDAATQRQETIDAVEKYNNEINAIEEAQLAKRLALNDKYADQVIAIAERAAEAAENALRKLEDQRAKLALDLGRSEIDAERQAQYDQIDQQVEFQREEAKAYRDHVAELKRIRKRALLDETNAIAERDVLAFVQARQAKKEALDAENEEFARERQERQIAFANERQDQKTQYDRERLERFIKYQRDLQDAQAQYTREIALIEQKRVQDLALAQQAYQRDTALLVQKYNQELTARRTAIAQELALITRGYQARLAIQTAYENAMVAQAQRLLSPAAGVAPASSSSPKPGFTNRNLPGFDTGGVITRTGAAIVHRGEIITNPKRGQSVSPNININGTSLEGTLRKVEQALIQAGY